MFNLNHFLQIIIEHEASDLHLVIGRPPTLRIGGELNPLPEAESLTSQDIESLLFPLLSNHQRQILENNWELDLGLDFEGKARFRVNIYKQRGNFAGAFRFIPMKIRTIEETGLPIIVSKLTELKQGLILVTGPTGHGKSTSLAAFVNQINLSRANHIITIEDPIEFVYPKGLSIISQRELNSDTKTWANALKSALREDPDVVLIGEMRDLETIASALTIAETGHLVFATLHTNSASQTIDRIVDVFPANQQPQIRIQLAAVLESIISQRLIPSIAAGRVLASEILFRNPALSAIIRDGKTHLIDNLIQTSAEIGMQSLESSLVFLVREGKISQDTALNYTIRPNLLNKLLGSG